MAKTLEDLIAWQLASELRDRVIAATARREFNRDWKLRNQLREAAASGPANVAEGFGRFRPREFAQFLRFAKGSVHEVRAHVDDAAKRAYLDEATANDLRRWSRRTSIAIARLILYLDRCPPEGPTTS